MSNRWPPRRYNLEELNNPDLYAPPGMTTACRRRAIRESADRMRDIASVSSANRKLSSDALYLAGLYEASERKTTDSGRTFTVPKPYIIEPWGLTSSEKQIPRNCWKH